MAVKTVIRMGHPTLRVKADPVGSEEINSDEFKTLVKNMFDTMEAEDGIGIAAPQIGVSKQVAIVGLPKDNPRYPDVELDQDDSFEILVVINPKITILDNETMGFWEGCLSVPGLRGYVERPKKISVEYLDLNGDSQKKEISGFGATVFQHEIDHLEGILYVVRIKDKTKLAFAEEYLEFVEKDQLEEE